jgi:hypothetical protein
MTEPARSPGETIAVVADLHLAGGGDDPFTEDGRFAATVDGLLSAASGRRLRLVLLGDTVDFPAVGLEGRRVTPATHPGDAVDKLRRVLAAHPAVLDALRRVVRAGHRIDAVAGNHDMELMLPGVQSCLRDAVGGGPDDVAVHPWMLYVPGVVYAEHGQQHHDVNRFPELGAGCPPVDRRLRVPAGSYIDALAHLRRRQPDASAPALLAQAARMGLGLAGGLVRLSRGERHREHRERRLATALPAALPPAAVLGIDRVAAATPSSIARRAAAMATARLRVPGAGTPVPYMQAAAQAVHHVLDAEGCAVPFYVFGHTHVAVDVPLVETPTARYLNPGTWSSMTRRVPGGDRRFGVVVIEREPGEPPRAELRGPT